jgi:hypothetical protein
VKATRTKWVYIVNWDYYQHGHKRGHPWFKVYHELLHNDRFLRLTAADRGTLMCLLMCISESGDGRVSADSKLLARRLNVRRVSLEPLVQAGFIQVRASKSLSQREHAASTEVEVLLRKTKTRANASAAASAAHARQEEEPPANGFDPKEGVAMLKSALKKVESA